MPNIQNYDEASIQLCGNFAEEFFKNFEQYKEKYKPGILFFDTNFEMLKKRNALDNYILKNYSKLNENNPAEAEIKKNMDIYLKRFYENFISHPTELIGSPFLRGPKTVETYCPEFVKREDGTNGELRKKVIDTYKQNTKDSKILYIRDRNGDNLTNEEIDRLMHFFITNIGADNPEIQKAQQEYIKKLISKKIKVSDLSTKQVEFLAKYINNSMLTSRLKQLGYNREDIKSYIYIGTDKESLGGFAKNNAIYINKNSNLTLDIPSLLQTVCHETEHSIQDLETQNPKSKIGLDLAISNVLREYYFSEKGYDVYNNNYRFELIEKDAENRGYRYARLFLDVLGFKDEADRINRKRNEKDKSRRFEYDYRINEEGKKCPREVFLYNNLNKAIKRHPDTISKYPALALLYSQDGEVKTFNEIISNEFKLNEDDKSNMLDDFCRYYIAKGELDKLDLSKFSEKEQANIASRLIHILQCEYLLIEMMGNNSNGYYYKDIAKEDKIGVETFHLKNTRNIMTFMNKNYQVFKRLQDKGSFTSIINMDYYDTTIEFFKQDSTYQKLAFDKTEKIEEIKRLAFAAIENKEKYRESKKQPTTFDQSVLESSFSTLVSKSRNSEFQQATHTLQSLPKDAILHNKQEVEEK